MEYPSSPEPPAASSSDTSNPPGFVRLSVGQCHRQTAYDRFGPGARVAICDRERAAVGLETIHPPGLVVTWPGRTFVPGEEEEDSIFCRVPSMQANRNNLTALSQRYNLYAVAYQGRIFIYKPRTALTHKLPARPDLQLIPRRTRSAASVGGFVDLHAPHTINSIMIGAFGSEEIVVACYDDGDVVAFWMAQVNYYVKWKLEEHGGFPGPPEPQPFLRDNVGCSAWGLAIHQGHRLIAVSSNMHLVTIFAPAITDLRSSEQRQEDHRQCPLCIGPVFDRCTFTHRIVVALGPNADNIPNICFLDDELGRPEMICAIDVKGNIWLAHIWRACCGAVYSVGVRGEVMKSEEFYPADSRGWGVVALPESSFMTVHTLKELVGFNPLDAFEVLADSNQNPQPIVNIGPGLEFVPDSPFHPRLVPLPLRPAPAWGGLGLLSILIDDATDIDIDIDEDDDEGQMGNPITLPSAVTVVPPEELVLPGNGQLVPELPPGLFADVTFADVLPLAHSWTLEESEEEDTNENLGTTFLANMCSSLRRTHGNMDREVPELENGGRVRSKMLLSPNRVWFPHLRVLMPVPSEVASWLRLLRLDKYRISRETFDKAGLAKVSERYRFLRTYEKDIEMRMVQDPTEKQTDEYSVVCPGVVVYKTNETAMMRRLFDATSRLNMTAHVPELCLVVVGSAQGNVVLVTPTRLAKPIKYRRGKWKHGFRVEYVLPRRSDQEARKTPDRPLHGIAVGPVAPDGDATSAATPKRFRLMIHFRNHEILTYELTREQQTGKLCIL